MKKLIKYILSVIISVSLIFTAQGTFADTGTLDTVLSTDRSELMPSDTVTLTLSFENNPGISGFLCDIIFDEDIFEYVSGSAVINEQIKFPTKAITTISDNALRLTLLSYGTDHYTEGAVLSATFKAKKNACGKAVFKISFPYTQDIYNAADEDVACTSNEVSVSVSSLGDSNCDGIVNAKDVIMIKMYLKNNVSINKNSSDVNSDGIIDIEDIFLIRDMISLS